MARKLLGVDDAAAYIGVSKWVLYALHRSGDAPKRLRIGRTIRYDEAMLDEYLDSCVEQEASA